MRGVCAFGSRHPGTPHRSYSVEEFVVSDETAVKVLLTVVKGLVGGIAGCWLLNHLRDRVIYPKRYGRPPDVYCTVISAMVGLVVLLAVWVSWMGWSR